MACIEAEELTLPISQEPNRHYAIIIAMDAPQCTRHGNELGTLTSISQPVLDTRPPGSPVFHNLEHGPDENLSPSPVRQRTTAGVMLRCAAKRPK